MKNIKNYLLVGAVMAAGIGLVSADHIDAPAVKGTTADITDFYAFQGENNANICFVVNFQGLMSPTTTAAAQFGENVLTEINIDTNADQKEDLVIQAIRRGDRMYFFGPVAPAETGKASKVNTAGIKGSVAITKYGGAVQVGDENGMKMFAGPREDPFFFDFTQYNKIIDGAATSFLNPGDDTFKGSNVMSIVVEVPKSKIGSTGTISAWVESKIK